jgi:hypothetical protein
MSTYLTQFAPKGDANGSYHPQCEEGRQLYHTYQGDQPLAGYLGTRCRRVQVSHTGSALSLVIKHSQAGTLAS